MALFGVGLKCLVCDINDMNWLWLTCNIMIIMWIDLLDSCVKWCIEWKVGLGLGYGSCSWSFAMSLRHLVQNHHEWLEENGCLLVKFFGHKVKSEDGEHEETKWVLEIALGI